MNLNAEENTAEMEYVKLFLSRDCPSNVCVEGMSHEMQTEVMWRLVYMEPHRVHITNLPFLSLGEFRKNGIWDTFLPLRDACKQRK